MDDAVIENYETNLSGKIVISARLRPGCVKRKVQICRNSRLAHIVIIAQYSEILRGQVVAARPDPVLFFGRNRAKTNRFFCKNADMSPQNGSGQCQDIASEFLFEEPTAGFATTKSGGAKSRD